MSDAHLEEQLIGLEAEVLALRKTLSIALFLLASNGLATRDGLSQIASILSEDLNARAAGEAANSAERKAMEQAAALVVEMTDAAARPLPASGEVAPHWPSRSQFAALESTVAALMVAYLHGNANRETVFSRLRQMTVETVRRRTWWTLDEAEAERLRRDSEAETDRLFISVARALGISLEVERESNEAAAGEDSQSGEGS